MHSLAEDARALLHATSEVAGDKVAEARNRLSAALERSKELYGAARERAIAGAKAVQSLLFGLRPSDPVTLLAAVVALAAVAFAASYFPARRAAKLDPMVALREE